MKKKRPTYYLVFGFKDGTVVSGIQLKRRPPSRPGRKVKPDPDGVCTYHETSCYSLYEAEDRTVIVTHLAIANNLNTRRAIRELLHPQLDQVEQRLTRMEQQLDRIEAAISKLTVLRS